MSTKVQSVTKKNVIIKDNKGKEKATENKTKETVTKANKKVEKLEKITEEDITDTNVKVNEITTSSESEEQIDYIYMMDRHHDQLKEMMKENRSLKKEFMRLQKREDNLSKKLDKKKTKNENRQPPRPISFNQSDDEHVSKSLVDFIHNMKGHETLTGINRQDCVKIINEYIKNNELGVKGGFKLDDTLSKLFPNLEAQGEEVIKRTEIMGAMNQHFPPSKTEKRTPNDTASSTVQE